MKLLVNGILIFFLIIPIINGIAIISALFIFLKNLSIPLTLENLPMYERLIVTYEGNDLKVDGETILINGEKVTEYTPDELLLDDGRQQA